MKKNKKIYCFDLDNTICTTIKNHYHKSRPKKKVIELINLLFDKGHTIKIFTSRYMGRNNENVKLAKSQGAIFTTRQLKKWKIKYHQLILGKPSYDVLVDDKSLDFKKDWYIKLKKKLR